MPAPAWESCASPRAAATAARRLRVREGGRRLPGGSCAGARGAGRAQRQFRPRQPPACAAPMTAPMPVSARRRNDGFIVVAVLWILGALATLVTIYAIYVT